MRLLTLLLLACLSCQALSDDIFSTPNNRLGQESTNAQQFLPVEQAYQLSLDVISPQQLRLYWQIESGYYLYKDRFKWLLHDGENQLDVVTDYPPAVKHEDEYFGKVDVYYTQADIMLHLPQNSGNLTIDITSQGCADAGLCYPPYTQRFSINSISGQIVEQAVSREPATKQPLNYNQGTFLTFLYMALLAFVGGSILNLMPCVFPVLSLKVLNFTQSEEHQRHMHSWAYAAGVVCSFVLVAVVLIALQTAGNAVGWGFQLQSPIFVVLMAYLFVIMGLGLSGLTELGASWMGFGSQLANRGGVSGSFFTGVLATLVASPCTAPFMGTALGFALGQPPAIALTVFAALGAGMATPMVLLGYSAGLRNLMPKPGAWMQSFKQLLAFPLYATAIWLLWITGRQTGVNGMAIALLGCLLLVFALWLWPQSTWKKIIAVLTAAIALALLASPLLDARQIEKTEQAVSYSPQQLQKMRNVGRPVFVNVTADWCITCIANESTALSSEKVLEAFRKNNIAYLKADWTNYDSDIAQLLKQYQRSGVPLYLLYPANSLQAPIMLPQLLTSNTVLDYIDKIQPKVTDF